MGHSYPWKFGINIAVGQCQGRKGFDEHPEVRWAKM